MGQALSCKGSHEDGLFRAVQSGDLQIIETMVGRDPSLLHQTTVYDRDTPLHIAAAKGQIEVGLPIFPSLFSRFQGVSFFSFVGGGGGCGSLISLMAGYMILNGELGFWLFGRFCRCSWIDLSIRMS